MPGSMGSTPRAMAGRTSVPRSTAKIRTAVRGAGILRMIAMNMVTNSPMLQEKTKNTNFFRLL